jgi:hypothetical protein
LSEKDVSVEVYFSKQPPERREIMERLREILFDLFPECNEYMAWGVAAYDDLFYIANLPKQVNMGFSIVGLPPEDVKRFQGGGKTMRHMKYPSIDSIDKDELVELIKLVKKKAKPVIK